MQILSQSPGPKWALWRKNLSWLCWASKTEIYNWPSTNNVILLQSLVSCFTFQRAALQPRMYWMPNTWRSGSWACSAVSIFFFLSVYWLHLKFKQVSLIFKIILYGIQIFSKNRVRMPANLNLLSSANDLSIELAQLFTYRELGSNKMPISYKNSYSFDLTSSRIFKFIALSWPKP